MKFLPIFLTILGTAEIAGAQQWAWVRDDRVLNRSGVQSRGLARIDVGDIDGDGYLDLIMLDNEGLQIYRNLASTDFVQFARRPDWEMDIDVDSVEYYVVPTLADLDDDGLAEVIIPHAGLEVWKTSGISGAISWVRADSLLEGVRGSRYLALADLDGDGDLDAITPNPNKLWVYWNTGTPLEPMWQADSTAFNQQELKRESGRLGYFNNVRLADVDGDGDPDLFATFDVPIAFGNLAILENVSSADSLHFRRFIPPTGFFGASSLNVAVGDVNNDGTRDFMLADYLPFILFWKNVGTLQQMGFDKSVVWGAPRGFLEANISVGDVDGDSDLDLVLANADLPTDIAPAVSHVKLYLNDGNARFFHWQQTQTVADIGYQRLKATVNLNDFSGNGELGMATGASIVKGDLFDYEELGSVIVYYKKQQGSHLPYWVADSTVFAQFSSNSVYHDPVLFDFNGDASLDLLVQVDKEYQFFENVGTLENPAWEMRPEWLKGLEERHHYRVAVGDLSKNGLPDLVFGELDGTLHAYQNIGTNALPIWRLNRSSFEGIAVDSSAAPALGDLDGDGDLDLLLGDFAGKVIYYRNDSVVSVESGGNAGVRRFSLEQNYPNPFNPETTIEYGLTKPGHVQLTIYNLLGQRVRTLVDARQPAGSYRVSWDGRTAGNELRVSSGVYVYELKFAKNAPRRKMILLR